MQCGLRYIKFEQNFEVQLYYITRLTLLASLCGGALHLNPLQLSLAQITLSGIKLVLKKKSFLHTLYCINQKDKAKKRKGEFSKRARLKILRVLFQAKNEYRVVASSNARY